MSAHFFLLYSSSYPPIPSPFSLPSGLIDLIPVGKFSGASFINLVLVAHPAVIVEAAWLVKPRAKEISFKLFLFLATCVYREGIISFR